LGRGRSRNGGRNGEAGGGKNENMGKASHGGTLRGCVLFDMQTAGSPARRKAWSEAQDLSYRGKEHASFFHYQAPSAADERARGIRAARALPRSTIHVFAPTTLGAINLMIYRTTYSPTRIGSF